MNEQAACTLIWQYVNKLPKKDVRMRPSTAFTTVELTKDYKLCVPNYTESIRINVFASHAALSLIPNNSWRTHRIESVCARATSRFWPFQHFHPGRFDAHTLNMHKYA